MGTCNYPGDCYSGSHLRKTYVVMSVPHASRYFHPLWRKCAICPRECRDIQQAGQLLALTEGIDSDRSKISSGVRRPTRTRAMRLLLAMAQPAQGQTH